MPEAQSVATVTSLPVIENPQAIPSNQTVQTPDPAQAQAQSENKQFGWVDIMPFAIEDVVARLMVQHGYDKDFYLNIWQAFSAKMDSEGEAVPTMDIARKRFLAYAQATMMNFKQGNYRYNATTQRNEQTRLNLIEKWQKYIGNPDKKILNQVNLAGLQTPVIQVWDSFISRSYEREIPLKNVAQLEAGFKKYLASWIENEKPKTYSNSGYSKTNSRSQINLDDTSWADGLSLED